MLWQKNTSFLEVLKFLSKNGQIWCDIGEVSVFPSSGTPVGHHNPPNVEYQVL